MLSISVTWEVLTSFVKVSKLNSIYATQRSCDMKERFLIPFRIFLKMESVNNSKKLSLHMLAKASKFPLLIT